jgi:hypothetical protein
VKDVICVSSRTVVFRQAADERVPRGAMRIAPELLLRPVFARIVMCSPEAARGGYIA